MENQLIQSIRDSRLVINYSVVAALALVMYDYMLTLRHEIALIWFVPCTYTKVLFLLTRYMPIIETWMSIYNQLFLNVPQHRCSWTVPVAYWITALQVIFAELILGVRTWAIWHRDKRIAAFLVSLMICNMVVQLVFLSKFLNSVEYAPPLYPGARGCNFARANPSIILANCIMLIVFQSSVLFLLLISFFRAYRFGINRELSKIIYMDGIMFYVYLLCLTIGSGVLALHVRESLVPIIWPLEDVLYPILTTRIILRIRMVGRSPGGSHEVTELHGGYNDRRPEGTLEFSSL